MFSVHCPRHGTEVLLGHHQILGVDGCGRDLTIRWECWCGYRGRIRRTHPAPPTRVAPAHTAL